MIGILKPDVGKMGTCARITPQGRGGCV
jgi:hypothetical protein